MAKNKKEEIKEEEVKAVEETEEITEECAEGILESSTGYITVIGGVIEEFAGDKKIAFGEALKNYKLKKSI